MKMKVSIKETTIIKPAKETPQKNLWNSDLDLLVPRIHIPTVYFYKQQPNSTSNFFEAKVLKDALSEVLVPFYPLAGRLDKDENGRIQINCNGNGALFMEAETSSVLDDFGDFTPGPHSLQLVPVFDYSLDHNMSSYPLLAVQLTRFKCGSVCLGVSLHHTVADGTSAIYFMNSWSDIARGISIAVPPFIDRTLLDARVPPTPIFHHTEYSPPPVMKNASIQIHEAMPTCTEILKITYDQLTTLKSKFKNNESGISYSTYEILTAHIWYCMCKARELDDDQETKLYIATDGRFRLIPPLPPGYFGNVLFTTTVLSSSGEIESRPLVETMEKIHKSLRKMDDGYLRSALDYLKKQSDLTVLMRGANTFKCPNLNIVSWVRLPIHDADFGWGRPVYMGPAKVVFEGMAYIMPSANNDKNLSLIICLHTNHMESFHKFFYDF
ncbi:shikimate O-hydroxycinnamoyltransferase-like [Euphorbia lathyris]|uniref:shikimate O-hydroxycinnamoyltransferase-like n=1 Tax=Euphorbia lathyris TaxID=212925 RepID=UPI0033134462